jgi:hypothetical protein
VIHRCHVCQDAVEPDEAGKVRFEGITEAPKGKAWVWGPVAVHEQCRLDLATPYDDRIVDGYVATWQRLTP